MKEQHWILLDTETTGFKTPIFVVELGAQKMLGWQPDGPSFRRVLNHNADIPPEASRVNGYTREILERDGESPYEVYADFASYVDDLPLVAYNLSYDLDKVLLPEWERLGIEPIGRAGFCALKLAQRLLDPVPAGNCKLQTLRQYYRLPERGAHTALGDVETVADLMNNVLQPLTEQLGLNSWEDIVSYTMAPWFPSRIAFGKFKGCSFVEAIDDPALHAWLEWLASSSSSSSAKMGQWYLKQLSADTAPLADASGNDVALGDGSGVVAYLDPELVILHRLIADARDRLAELQSEYTHEHCHVDAIQARLFSLLRPLYEERDQLRITVDYRRNYIVTLLSSGEEEAESIKPEYQRARRESEREYEQAAEKAEQKQDITDEDAAELKNLYGKLVRLYHPDRFAQDPEKQEAYTRLTSDINNARDQGNIQLLHEIANDVNGYMAKQGIGSLDFQDSIELPKLRALYDTLQLDIISMLEELDQLRESSGYELYKASLDRPDYVEEIAGQQAETITAEIKELIAEALQLANEIEGLTGREDYLNEVA